MTWGKKCPTRKLFLTRDYWLMIMIMMMIKIKPTIVTAHL